MIYDLRIVREKKHKASSIKQPLAGNGWMWGGESQKSWEGTVCNVGGWNEMVAVGRFYFFTFVPISVLGFGIWDLCDGDPGKGKGNGKKRGFGFGVGKGKLSLVSK